MKVFVVVLSVIVLADAEQSSSQTFSLGGTTRSHSATHTPGPKAPAPYPAPAPYKPTYAPAPAPSYPPPAYQQPAYPAEPASYEYQYAVKDDYAGVDFDANETRKEYTTNGGYRVLLPDGRIQTVTYTVNDAKSGYIADVSYEGEARYDEPAPYKPPPPAYEPAPVYPPRPSYDA